ncbi:MAG: hypothetical protein IT360_27875 [Gemmatimonadaceae bacterium]|nr:hypothetical protein [Gemmatimonadaceae bacterium]
MTLDQQLQLWNAIGTWVAGVATFGAVIVALHLARRSESVRLRAFAGLRQVILGDGSPFQDHLCIGVTNIGDRPVTVNTVGWSIGARKKRRYCIQTLSGPHTSQYPVELAHGKSASFMVSFDETPNWPKEFAREFVKDVSDANLRTLRALINTSVGKSVPVKPEQDLLERLKKSHAEA